ncbi:hypothetical protein Tco_1454880, partial [Tanacetum coccineum]
MVSYKEDLYKLVLVQVPVVLTDPIVAPEEGTVLVVSPFGVLDVVDYSPSSNSDPSEDSLPPAPDLPLVSPFLCSNDSEADGKSEPAEQRPVSSSHDTLAPLLEFPLAHVVAPPGIRQCLATLIQPDEAILLSRPYRTHLNRLRKLLTARKRVRPIPAHRLAWRHVSHHSSYRHSSPDLSSSSAFIRYRCAPFSTPYPPSTSESSLGSSSERSLDSSLPSFRPSRKRCRFPTALVPSHTHVSRSIAPNPTNLLPPRNRFRDSYSLKDSGEEHIEVDTADAEAVTDVGISEGVVAHPEEGVGMGFEIAASDVREDDEEFKAEASVIDTREIAIDPLAIGDSSEITKIETTQKQLEASQLVASGERTIFIGTWNFRKRTFIRTITITRSGMTPEAIEELINRRVEQALAAHEATRAANALEAENQIQNGSNDDNGNYG